VIAGYSLGLPYGSSGVALGFSAVMTLWTLPHIVWGVYGTPISFGDVIKIMIGPLLSGVVGWQEPWEFNAFASSGCLSPIVAGSSYSLCGLLWAVALWNWAEDVLHGPAPGIVETPVRRSGATSCNAGGVTKGIMTTALRRGEVDVLSAFESSWTRLMTSA
jgi:hypothetical protein